MRLEGKTALITGASRGIGQAIALGYAREGANVALVARSDQGLRETAEQAEEHGVRALALPCDVSDRAALRKAFTVALEAFGDIDILVNNAGRLGSSGPFLELTDEDWALIMDANFHATVQLLQMFGRHAVERGSGSVVNITSVAAVHGAPSFSHYAVTKAGTHSLTKSLAAEWAGSGVRVNEIAPGWVATALTEGLAENKEAAAGLMRAVPSGRWADPADIAEAAVFLAADSARMVTGSCLTIDGGATSYWGGPTMLDMVGLGRNEAP